VIEEERMAWGHTNTILFVAICRSLFEILQPLQLHNLVGVAGGVVGHHFGNRLLRASGHARPTF